MAMTGGAVTVDSSGVASGDGMSRAIYEGLLLQPAAPTTNVAWKQAVAGFANVLGPAIVGYIQSAAVARVSSQSLGRTPDPNDPNQPIQAPASPVDLPIF